MSVADRRYVPDETTQAFRAAGISHMLVVSGMHLSILASALHAILLRVTRRRRAAAGCSIVFVLLFMAFTGFGPSIVRSGLVWILMFSAQLFRRRADVYTSLALAALVLLIQNPYACLDVGLQLSFTATLGALISGVATGWWCRHRRWKAGRPRRMLRKLGELTLTPVCVMLATLPVLVAAGMELTLFSIPVNILIVPLMPVFVLCGLVMAIPPALPVLGWLGGPAGALGGGLLGLLEKLAQFCQANTWAVIPLGGLFAFVVVLALYALGLLAWRSRRVVACGVAAALLVPFALVLNLALSQGTVLVQLAGNGADPSLVAMRDGQAVVLYRSRQTLSAVQQVLRQNRVQECVLLVDMRADPNSREYVSALNPTLTVVANEDVVVNMVCSPMRDVEVSVVRQADGLLACVDIDGYKLAVYTGRVNLSYYAQTDLLLAGRSAPQGGYGALLTSGAPPEWAADVPVWQNAGSATVWVRPGKSVIFKEVRDGTTG